MRPQSVCLVYASGSAPHRAHCRTHVDDEAAAGKVCGNWALLAGFLAAGDVYKLQISNSSCDGVLTSWNCVTRLVDACSARGGFFHVISFVFA